MEMVTTLSSILKWPIYYLTHNLKPKRPEIIEHFYQVRDDINDKVSLWKGDITKLKVDCIVNAANPSLLGGGGVDGAIHEAAGPDLVKECATLKGCRVGEAKITKGYNLPAKYVIHTVGTMTKDPVELAESYKNSFSLMIKYSLRSIAFPCISTGVYGYPPEEAAHVALYETRTFLEKHGSGVERVVFCVFSDQDVQVYEELMQRYFPTVAVEPATPQDVLDNLSRLNAEDRKKCEDLLATGRGNVKLVADANEILGKPEATKVESFPKEAKPNDSSGTNTMDNKL